MLKHLPCFVLFKQVDVAVLEVGLGGKYDATNVVCSMLIIIFYSNNIITIRGSRKCS
jgi:hypothetical protein